MAVPDLASAQRAAEEMVCAGVGTVLLFGSLARGEACEVSDIDLVAIYDDLGDYSERATRRCALETRASAAAGCRVDVYVTDAPEWARRSATVPCSLEARIAGYAIELADAGVHASIDWDKEIGLPSDATGELQHRFTDMSDALARLTANLRPGVDEVDAAADGDLDEAAALEGVRFAAAMGEVHMVAESAAKALHIAHVGTTPAHTHAIAGLLAPLPGHVRDGFTAAAGSDVSLGELHLWRQGATYAADRPISGFDGAVLVAHAAAAVRIAGLAADKCRRHGLADDVLASFDRRHRRADAALDTPA
ncbi:nucleotidyltransferase domain-containing protein [Candidatus Poriferisodalis sp.]|uniref:nucleotidyltransferase domain-containing protein n=1 Tax=Candidatus Poriferisodalis sp. TaxID=3101277 RepID=UPI003B014388